MKRFSGVWKLCLVLAISCVSILGMAGCNKDTVTDNINVGTEENATIESETTESKVEENVTTESETTEMAIFLPL